MSAYFCRADVRAGWVDARRTPWGSRLRGLRVGGWDYRIGYVAGLLS